MAFEAFAVVEIMGHQRIAGKVSEQVIGGASMLRVDVPKTTQRDAFTKFFSAAAIYSITPTDETLAQVAAENLDEAPIQPYILRVPQSPLLAAKVEREDASGGTSFDYSDCLDSDDGF